MLENNTLHIFKGKTKSETSMGAFPLLHLEYMVASKYEIFPASQSHINKQYTYLWSLCIDMGKIVD